MQDHNHFLKEFVRDFAEGIHRADARMPIATSARSEKTYQSGIGPHTETRTVELVVV